MGFLKNFFRRLFCGCCGKDDPLEEIDDTTIVLPNLNKKDITEKTEIIFYGHVPKPLSAPFDVGSLATFTKYEVKKIVFSAGHCIVMFANVKNELAVFGSNENGQLGLEYYPKVIGSANYYNEMKLKEFEFEGTSNFEFLDVSAAENYTLVLVKFNDGKKFGNKNYVYKFSLRDGETTVDYSLDDKMNVIHKEEIKYDKIKLIKQIYTPENRDVLLLEDNSVMLKGTNFDLEIFDKYKLIVDPIEFMMDIHYLCFGNNFCLIMTEGNQVFAMGDNEYGELGIPNVRFVKFPTLIDFFEREKLNVKKVCCGARHSLVLTENDTKGTKLFSFGDNSEGQCTGLNLAYSLPTEIKFIGEPKIVDIYSGYNHSVALTATGEVFTWGDTSSGKLGYHTGSSTQSDPKAVPYLNIKNISYIAVGPMQTALVTSSVNRSIITTYNTTV